MNQCLTRLAKLYPTVSSLVQWWWGRVNGGVGGRGRGRVSGGVGGRGRGRVSGGCGWRGLLTSEWWCVVGGAGTRGVWVGGGRDSEWWCVGGAVERVSVVWVGGAGDSDGGVGGRGRGRVSGGVGGRGGQ